MKRVCALVFMFCLCGILLSSRSPLIRIEDTRIYFKKGVYKTFFNDPFPRLREIQSEYPEIVFELSLYQLKSEPRKLALKRYGTLLRSFQKAGLDMDRIVFASKAIYVENFTGHALSVGVSTLDSVGAVLEGKVRSLD